MERERLPEQIRGNWIWHREGLESNDCFMLLRKEFMLDDPGLEARLWISANSVYQLFVNDRLIGGGPRPHTNPDRAYADCYEVGVALQSGLNLIGLVVRYDARLHAGTRRTPGVWCQLEVDHRPVVWTGPDWRLHPGAALAAPRGRRGEHRSFCDYRNLIDYPRNWLLPTYRPESDWLEPELVLHPGTGGTALELHPVAPPQVEDQLFFDPRERGTFRRPEAWTALHFDALRSQGAGTYAGCTFLFSEKPVTWSLVLFADDPTRLFCNNQLVMAADRSFGQRLELHLVPGWNRLLVFQQPAEHGCGLTMIFPELTGHDLRIYQDTLAEALPAWNLAGPLRLPMSDATPSLKFERLHSQTFIPQLDRLTDPEALLRFSQFQPAAGERKAQTLATGEYEVFRLDTLRYGYARVELTADAGDVVDFTLGFRREKSGFTTAGRERRSTHTLVCREGLNLFLNFIPDPAEYLLITVRRARHGVNVQLAAFDELSRPYPAQTFFSSASAELNELWRVGASGIRRSTGFIPPPMADEEHDQYLLDAYLDAMNVVTLYGDYHYSAARLRQFVAAQYENGDIPPLSLDGRHSSQLHQLFFLPAWMLFNYRYSGDRRELAELRPHLDMALEFFEALQDPETGLLHQLDRRAARRGRLSAQQAAGEPTYLNALLCRFLLSSADIYDLLNNKGTAVRCRKQMKRIVAALRENHFDADAGLFTENARDASRNGQSGARLFANLTALLGGVMPLENFEHFFFSYFNFDPPFDRYAEAQTPYFNFLFMELLFSLELSDWAFRYFIDYWRRHRCPEPAAWSFGGDRRDPASIRFNNGLLYAPNPVLLREVAGIRPAEPGFSAIYLHPASQLTDWVDVTLPTVNGRLRIRWEKLPDNGLSILIDANFPLKVLPELSPEALQQTEFELSESVILLKPPAAK